MRQKSAIASKYAPFLEVVFSFLAAKPSIRSVTIEKRKSIRKREELPILRAQSANGVTKMRNEVIIEGILE